MTRVVVLTNPLAGHGKARQVADRAIARLRERGAEVSEIVGVDAADALAQTRAAVMTGPDAFVAVGGDGLISIALQALARSGIPLGIVPAGTGNDHAREHGIPTLDPEAAADVVLDGRAKPMDLGHAQMADGSEKWFGTVLATGFDSLVSDRTNRMSWPHGRMRYNVAIVAEFLNLKPLAFTLTLDDGQVLERSVVLAAVGNTQYYGGGMQICPGADPTDGLVDITIINYVPRLRLARLFPTVFKGTHIDLDPVETLRVASVEISSPGINAYADGEYVGPLAVTVTAVPQAISVLVPR